MRRLVLLALFSALAAMLAGTIAAEQQPSRSAPPPASGVRAPNAAPLAAKPYTAVAVKLPAAPEDASFETFRSELSAVAKRRVYAELERLVMQQEFFWDRDFNGGFERKRPGVDNLATALRLEQRNGMGWGTLAAFAAEPTASAFNGRPAILCAPGEASFNDVEFDHLMDDTRSKPRDWVHLRADKTEMHAAPRGNAAVIATLDVTLVRLLGYLAKDKEPDTMRAAWARVISPGGKIGFVAPGGVTSLSPERLCYGRDGFGRWRIAGYVGAGE